MAAQKLFERLSAKIAETEEFRYPDKARDCAKAYIGNFYNGKKGRYPTFSKWIFYVFYPMHLLVAYIIKLMIGELEREV